MLKKFGPGSLVAAAFIGPGTIVTCSAAGVSFGYEMLGALMIGIMITYIFQEMNARMVVANHTNLSSSLLSLSENRLFRSSIKLIIILSIFVGNSAYQSGNITGASIGLNALLDSDSYDWVLGFISVVLFVLLWFGKYHILERAFMVLVGVMGLVFVVILLSIGVNVNEVISDAWTIPTDNADYFVAMSLIGTTVVPYNLFLHSNAILKKWNGNLVLSVIRNDLLVSILFGGLISVSILVVFGSQGSSDVNIKDLNSIIAHLSGSLGEWSKYLVALGVFLAGLTSSLTAPMAASFALSGFFERYTRSSDVEYKLIWMTVYLVGVLVAFAGVRPLFLIQVAQFTNGIILPLIGILLFISLNQKSLGSLKNSTFNNLLSLLVILLLIVLGSISLYSLFHG